MHKNTTGQLVFSYLVWHIVPIIIKRVYAFDVGESKDHQVIASTWCIEKNDYCANYSHLTHRRSLHREKHKKMSSWTIIDNEHNKNNQVQLKVIYSNSLSVYARWSCLNVLVVLFYFPGNRMCTQLLEPDSLCLHVHMVNSAGLAHCCQATPLKWWASMSAWWVHPSLSLQWSLLFTVIFSTAPYSICTEAGSYVRYNDKHNGDKTHLSLMQQWSLYQVHLAETFYPKLLTKCIINTESWLFLN